MVPILALPIILLNIMLIAFIIMFAVRKKLNVLVWAILAIIGIFGLPLFNYLFAHLIRPREFAILLASFSPLLYTITLLTFVLLKKSKNVPLQVLRCGQCQTILKPGMAFCPTCGSQVGE